MKRRIFHPGNILAVALMLWVVTPLVGQEQAKEPIKHRVRVSAQIVPLFAIEKSGSPVIDLKGEDLVLYVNGKEVPIDYLIKSEYLWTTEKKNEARPSLKAEASTTRRLIFIIMDSLFNSRYGINRMKTISKEIIKQGKPGDFFILLGINKLGGLYHLAGPKPRDSALLNVVDQIKFDLDIKSLRARRIIPPPPPPSSGNATRRPEVVDPDVGTGDRSQAAMYTLRVEKYFESLQAMKYLMMKYLQPKLVFLLSEGIKEARYGGTDLLRVNLIIKEMNQAGAMIFTINPGRIRSFMDTDSGKSFLSHVARQSGGEFYENQRIDKVVKKLDNTNRSYYEMVFHLVDKQEKGDLKIEVKSLRPGLKILVPQQATNYQRFSQMSAYGREFFIVDLIEGGRWSQLVSDVKDIPFEISVKEERGSSLAYTLLVDIPSPLVTTHSDIYIVRLQKNQRTRIHHYKKSLKEKEKLKIMGRIGEHFYFVIHEPRANVTLFAKVK